MAILDVSSLLNISLFDILALFALLTLCFIKPKSKPEELESKYLKTEIEKSIKIISKIEKRIFKIRKDLKQNQTDERLIKERERYLRKLAKSKKPRSEIDAELQQADTTIFKDILEKYSDEKPKKKSKTKLIDKDSKEISKNVSKKNSVEKSTKKLPKNFKENSNE